MSTVGVAPGTTTLCMRGLGEPKYGPPNTYGPNCPPDPVWGYITPSWALNKPHIVGASIKSAAKTDSAIQYGTESTLRGIRDAVRGLRDARPGPFGMSWAGFAGVIAIALAGGIGLGYLSKRRERA